MTELIPGTLIPDGLPPYLTGLIGAPLIAAATLRHRDENYLPIANDHRRIGNWIHRDHIDADDATIRTPTTTYVVILGYYDPGSSMTYGNIEALAERLTDDTAIPTAHDENIYDAVTSDDPRALLGTYPNAVSAILAALRDQQFRFRVKEVAYDAEISQCDIIHSIYRVLSHA
jgi:hypothetical protein